MKRALFGLWLAAASGCSVEEAVGKAVDTTIEVVASPAFEPVLETTLAAADVTVRLGADLIDALVGDPDCRASVEAYANSACEAECERAKTAAGADPAGALEACPEFAR